MNSIVQEKLRLRVENETRRRLEDMKQRRECPEERIVAPILKVRSNFDEAETVFLVICLKKHSMRLFVLGNNAELDGVASELDHVCFDVATTQA